MHSTETTEAINAIGMMLKAFPSSQSTITADSARVYMFAVEDMPLDAVKRACRMFVRGEVKGRNNAFAPSAPELVDVCRQAEGVLKVEHYEADRLFIEADTPAWEQMLMHKGATSLPVCNRNGKRGWFFAQDDAVAAAKLALPPPISEAEQARRAEAVRGLSRKTGVKFTVGDPDAENGDMGQIGAVA
jgi:hypothetical protein